MEIAKTIPSPSQIPLISTEITPAEELGGIQGKATQSPSFGLLFDHWTGMAQGVRSQNDAGSNLSSQGQLKGESPPEQTSGEAKLNDPFRVQLLSVTNPYSADLFKMAKGAPDKIVQQLPEQDSGVSAPAKGEKSAAGPTKGDNSVTETATPMTALGLQQKIGKGGNTGATTADRESAPAKGEKSAAGPTEGDNSVPGTATPMTALGLQQKIGKGGNTGVTTTDRASAPVKEEKSAAGPTKGENSLPGTATPMTGLGLQQKIGKGGNTGVTTTDTSWGLRTNGANKAQLPRENPSAVEATRELPVSAAQGGQFSDPPRAGKTRETSEEGGKTDPIRAPLDTAGNLLSEGNFATSLPGSAGEVQQQGNTQPENGKGQPVIQPGDLLQTAEGAATGFLFESPAKAPDSLQASGTPSQASILKVAEPCQDFLPGIEELPGDFGSASESAVKTGGGAVIPEANGDIQAGQQNLSSRSYGIYSEAVDSLSPEADVASRDAAPANQMQSRSTSEAAGNAYRAVKAEAIQPGKNDVPSMPANVSQGKPQATPDSNTANAGIPPDQVKIIFAEGPGSNRKNQGEALPLEPGEGKASDNSSTPAFVTNPAESRASGENSVATPSPDAESPLGYHVTNQIRERLDAGNLDSGNGQITLKLHPEELGELKISMRMENQHLNVEITAQNPSVKDALMQNLDTLKETLSRQNIAMDRFDVSADIPQGSHQGGRDGKQMTQDNRVNNSGAQHAEAIEEDAAPRHQYSWENEESLVNLVL